MYTARVTAFGCATAYGVQIGEDIGATSFPREASCTGGHDHVNHGGQSHQEKPQAGKN